MDDAYAEYKRDIEEIKELLKSMQKNIQIMMNAIEHDEKYIPMEEHFYDVQYTPSTQACNIDEWLEDTSVSKRNF